MTHHNPQYDVRIKSFSPKATIGNLLRAIMLLHADISQQELQNLSSRHQKSITIIIICVCVMCVYVMWFCVCVWCCAVLCIWLLYDVWCVMMCVMCICDVRDERERELFSILYTIYACAINKNVGSETSMHTQSHHPCIIQYCYAMSLLDHKESLGLALHPSYLLLCPLCK